jgi:pyridoxine 5-phosphate synthase
MVKLSICVDQVAAFRNIAHRGEPDPMAAIIMAQIGGATAITISWAPDPPFYQKQEFTLIRQLIHTHMNVIMTPADDVLQSVLTIRPDMVTLVPGGYQHTGLENEWLNTDWPEKNSTGRSLDQTISALQQQNILVSVLIRPSAADVRLCSQLKADYVHIDTSIYTSAGDAGEERQAFNDLASTAKVAARMNLGVSMGRGIDYQTASDITGIWEVEEMVVGYAVTTKAMSIGYEQAVRDLIEVIRHAPKGYE